MTNSPLTLPSKIVKRGTWEAMPTTAADISTKTCCVVQMIIQNPTAGALTFTITDKATSPLSVWTAKSLAAGAEYVLNAPNGVWFTSGMTAASSGAGLVWSLVLLENLVS